MEFRLENLNLERSFDLTVEDTFGILLKLSDITTEEAALWIPSQAPEPKQEAEELPFIELPHEELSNTEIEELDYEYFDWQTYFEPSGPIPIVHYDITRDQTEADMQVIDVDSLAVVGLDCEWAENDKRSHDTLPDAEYANSASRMKRITDCLSVILLSCEINGVHHIYIIHLSRFPTVNDDVDQLIPLKLRRILESSDILKVGVGVKGDGDRIEQWLGIKVNGLRCTLQMQRVANGEPQSFKHYRGMQGLTKTHLALAVKDKDCFGQTSVWNILGDLLPRQYQYACNDALIPLLLDAALFQQLLDHAYVPHQDVPTETSSYTPPKPRVIDPTQKDQIAAFEKNDPDSLALLDKLTSLRDSILVAQGHDPYGLPNIQFYVANSRSILRLTQHRPSTAEEMRNVKGLGGPTKKEYFFDFLNAVQAHLGLEGTPEPEGWKDQYNKGKAAGKLFLERLKEEGFGFIFCDEKTWAVIWEGGVDGVGC